jgi:hypothetical protein
LSVITSDPETALTNAGVKLMTTVQVADAASVAPQLLEATANALDPEIATELIDSAALPELVSVSD